MANALYRNYAHLIWGDAAAAHALPDLDTDNIKCVLTDHGADTPVLATDQDLTDITAGTVATSANMAGAAIATGSIDYNDFAFATVAGAQSESLNWYLDSGAAGTSTLFLYVDTATGLPVTPSGGDINVTLNASGLMSLAA